MKATLEFNLPEDKDEFEIASHASSYRMVIFDMDAYLRSRLKYEQNTEEVHTTLQAVRDKLYEILSQNTIEL